MATFRQRGTAWRAELSVDGNRESATFDTKAQAKAWAAKRETELREQARGKLPAYTLAQAMIRYRDEVSPTKKGFNNEIKRINFILREYPALCRKQITKVTTDDLVGWRNARLKEVKPASVRRDGNVLSAIFSVARREWKWIHDDPMKDLRLPPSSPHRDRRVTDDEIERLCIAAGFNEAPPETSTQQVIIAFLFALESAMRAGEIRGLTWDRVFLSDRYISLLETKNGTRRNVPLSKRAVQLLEYMRAIDNDRVFTVNTGSFDTLFRKIRDRCQIENLHFHDTRHEACTRLARKIDVLDLARMIGHKDLKSLMIYYNPTATEIANRLDQ